MPWNNQGGGLRQGGGGRGPWGRPPRRRRQQPPDLEELLRRGQETGQASCCRGGGGPGFGGNRKALVLIRWCSWRSGWRAASIACSRTSRGSCCALANGSDHPAGSQLPPAGADRDRPDAQGHPINRVEIGFRSAADIGRGGTSRDVPEESLMLTGDENIVDINFVVLWMIKDAGQFLFNIRDPETTVKAVAESVMREIVGKTPIAEATTEARGRIEVNSREQMQQILDAYGAGILVTQVQLQKVDPPSEVIDAFRDVQRAQADRERAQNEAEVFANDILPRARGDAERISQEAQAYRQEVVAKAEGEASRFLAVYQAYSKARDVTTKRIYLETMEQVLRGMNKVVIDPSASASGVVPYLPLPELERRGRAPPTTPGTAAGSATGTGTATDSGTVESGGQQQ